MNMNFSEIRHDYIWGPAVENGANGDHDLLAAVSIDAWKSADDNEEGEVLANVFLTAHGDMIVDFHDNGVRMHQPVLDHIRAAEETLKQIWQEKVCQYSGKIVCATVLTIPRSVMDQINDYLNADTEDAYQGEDNTITYTARFPDGKEMDVKCCGCRDESSGRRRFSSIKTVLNCVAVNLPMSMMEHGFWRMRGWNTSSTSAVEK